MGNPLSTLADNIIIDQSKCITCGLCVDRCVLDNIRLYQAPCSRYCPLDLNVQGYVQLIARGEFEKAYAVVFEKLPFPGIIGRICSHPCEAGCNRNHVDGEAIAIRSLKRFLYDHLETQKPDLSIKGFSDKKVAIIGAGPAGMMAAWDLRKEGFNVTIFESSDVPGGMLSLTIPEFRLPAQVVQREFNYLREMGVEVCFNTRIGSDLSFQFLLQEFDAIFIAAGMTKSKKLGIPGEDAKGIYHALQYLMCEKKAPSSLAAGKNVLVIGGGDVAIDVAQTALRTGAKQVRVISLESRDELPASESALKETLSDGIEIECGWGPIEFVVQNDEIHEVKFQQCLSVFGANGAFSPKFNRDVTKVILADMLILAIGQKTSFDFLEEKCIETKDGLIAVDPVTLQTSNSKVFAGGDVIPGTNSVVHAMADGRRAAESIRRMLQGEDILFERDYLGSSIHGFQVDFSRADPRSRINLALPNDLKNSLTTELEMSMTRHDAQMEAQRCLNCGYPAGYHRTCWMCLPCEIECPYDALEVGIPFVMR